MNVLLLILGLVLVIAGADCLVNGAVAVAKRYRMPEFLIGLTIVGIGTSMPELVVSLIAGIEGKGGMAIGNVVGSNLANTLLILGAASLIQPISISPATKRIDIPYNILVTLVLFFMCFGFTFRHYPTGGVITWWKGILLLALFAGYMAYSFRTATKGRTETAQAAETGSRPCGNPSCSFCSASRDLLSADGGSSAARAASHCRSASAKPSSPSRWWP